MADQSLQFRRPIKSITLVDEPSENRIGQIYRSPLIVIERSILQSSKMLLS